MKRMIVLMMIGVFTFTGCGGRNASQNNLLQESASSEASQEETEIVVEDEVETKTISEADAALEELFFKALECVEQEDKEGFKNLYRNTSDDIIDSDYEVVKDWPHYPDYQFYTVCGDNNYFAGNIYNTITTIDGNDTNSMQKYVLPKYSYGTDGWKFEYNDEEVKILNEVIMSVYPDQCVDAKNSERNISRFGGQDWSWSRKNVIIPNTVTSNVYLMWQNEDGSVSVMINVKNGTDVIKNIKTIDFSVEDNELGMVAQGEFSGNTMAPKTSENLIFNIPAEQVYTGTQPWGSLSSSTHINY